MTPLAKSNAHWLARLAAQARGGSAETISVQAKVPTASAWQAIVASFAFTDDELAALVASHYKLPLAGLRFADTRALRLVPEKVARRYVVLPLREDEMSLVVATCDPHNLEMEQALAFASGSRTAKSTS